MLDGICHEQVESFQSNPFAPAVVFCDHNLHRQTMCYTYYLVLTKVAGLATS